MLLHFYWDPKQGTVYNIGGSRIQQLFNCSRLSDLIAEPAATRSPISLCDSARSGDHIWWISDVRRFQQDFPSWSYSYDLRATLTDLIEAARERYQGRALRHQR